MQRGGETSLECGEAIGAATYDEASLRQLWVRLVEEAENLERAHADLVIDAIERGRNVDGCEGLALHLEEARGTLRGACAVFGPLVPEKLYVRRDVEVVARIRGTSLARAEDGIAAVVILRPETMNDEALLRRLALG